MSDKPTIYLSNWGSHNTKGHHGIGHKYTIMAFPRAWEHGDGSVRALVPAPYDLEAVRNGQMTGEQYKARYIIGMAARVEFTPIGPDQLRVYVAGNWTRPVIDGDTLCCACSRAAAAKGECHRVWAADLLAKAGWRVILDGKELEVK